MKSRTTLTEKQLRRAARMAEEYQMNRLSQETSHEFSEKFERDMAILLQRFANGHVKTDRIRYGWRYYAKRSVAAVLLGAILTCIAMPEAVVAGYNRIIEVVERFVLDDARAIDDEYTNINAATDFVADAEYLYYQGKECEIYRRPLANLTADSERLQLMTVDENYIFEDYAVGTLEEQSLQAEFHEKKVTKDFLDSVIILQNRFQIIEDNLKMVRSVDIVIGILLIIHHLAVKRPL